MRGLFAQFIVVFLLTATCCSASAKEHFDDLAALWGLEPMQSLSLTGDDVEFRFWVTSFGYQGFALSRRQGRWQMFHLGENNDSMVSVSYGYRAARLQPLCEPDQVLETLKTLGVETLQPPRRPPACLGKPDTPCLDRILIDGWSAFVEYKNSAGLIRQRYPVPGMPHFASSADNPMDYPSYRAEQMYDLLRHVLGGKPSANFKPHSRAFTLPAIVLSRATYAPGVQAFLIHQYDVGKDGGALRYERLYFREYPQGFEVNVFEENDDRTVDISWRGYRRMLIGEGNQAFRLHQDGALWHAVQDSESAANAEAHELSVYQKDRFEDLTYVDLSSGFERELADSAITSACRRAKPLLPQKPPSPLKTVQVDSVTNNDIDKSRWWRVLPPALASLKIVTVTGESTTHWMGAEKVAGYAVNQQLTVRTTELPPPSGSDKPVLLLDPVDSP